MTATPVTAAAAAPAAAGRSRWPAPTASSWSSSWPSGGSACWSSRAGSAGDRGRRRQRAGHAPVGQPLRPRDARHGLGWGAGGAVVRGSWVFPLLTSVVAGDVFSSEDRLGTWRHLLVAVRSPRRIFLAKALASLTVLALACPAGGLRHRRRTGGGQPAADRPRRSPAGTGGRRREAAARVALRARPPFSPSPRSGCSRRSSSAAPPSGCCCPPSAGSACSWRPRCSRCRPRSASRCPASPSCPGTACSPARPSSAR